MRAVVQLPGGLFREDGPPIAEAEVGPLSSADETWLAGCPHHMPTAHVVTELLARTVSRLGDAAPPPREQLRSLSVGDRDFLLLAVRRLTLGPELVAVVECPACGCALDAEFAADEVPVEYREQRAAAFECELRSPDGTQVTATVRCPTGADQEALALSPGGATEQALLARCLLALDGRPPSPPGLARLDAAAREQLDEQIMEAAPRVELAMDLRCPECGETFAADLGVTRFILRDLWMSARHVLREIHELAIHYHWSQAEIVSLPSGTRRGYLTLIEERDRVGLEAW